MAEYKDFHENHIKHMEMIQAVVSRLAGNSFLIKGWAITLTGVFLGFAVDRDDADLAVAALLPILVFWGLDTYYLRSERRFRALFDKVRKSAMAVEPFFMAATGPAFPAPADSSWPRTFVRGTLLWFYGVLLAAAGLVVLAICTGTAGS